MQKLVMATHLTNKDKIYHKKSAEKCTVFENMKARTLV